MTQVPGPHELAGAAAQAAPLGPTLHSDLASCVRLPAAPAAQPLPGTAALPWGAWYSAASLIPARWDSLQHPTFDPN